MSDNVASDEAKRQTIIFLFSIAGTIAAATVMYYFTNRAAWGELKMRFALRAKRFATKQVDLWQKLADDAATLYNQERP